MFSAQYIEKCKKARNEIQYFRAFEQFKEAEGRNVTPKPLFEVGDYFHHPDLMEEGEVKIVKEIKGSDLYASDPTEPYPQNDSILLPTVEQMRAGLEAVVWSLSDEDFKYGEEYLLDKVMETRKRKQWDKENREWADINR